MRINWISLVPLQLDGIKFKNSDNFQVTHLFVTLVVCKLSEYDYDRILSFGSFFSSFFWKLTLIIWFKTFLPPRSISPQPFSLGALTLSYLHLITYFLSSQVSIFFIHQHSSCTLIINSREGGRMVFIPCWLYRRNFFPLSVFIFGKISMFIFVFREMKITFT